MFINTTRKLIQLRERLNVSERKTRKRAKENTCDLVLIQFEENTAEDIIERC